MFFASFQQQQKHEQFRKYASSQLADRPVSRIRWELVPSHLAIQNYNTGVCCSKKEILDSRLELLNDHMKDQNVKGGMFDQEKGGPLK